MGKRPKKFREMIAEALGLSDDERKALPSGFHIIGDIAVLNLNRKASRYSGSIAEIVLREFPYIRTVCVREGPVEGEFRKPRIRVVGGESNTVTIHRESGCLFKLDVSKVMFSKGNLFERSRVAGLVRKGEAVADMFAGIGYFTIPIAKHSKAGVVYAIEKNPDAFSFLKENIKLNHLESKIVPILGDNREVDISDAADRILMGYLPRTFEFLPAAFRILKPDGGVMHYHDTYHKEELWDKPVRKIEEEASRNGYALSAITRKRKVKEYAPNIYHIVIDCLFKAKTSA